MAHKITAALRRTWQSQRDQLAEELASGQYQDGRPMTPEGKAEFAQDIAEMDKLLTYPVGTKFEKSRDLL